MPSLQNAQTELLQKIATLEQEKTLLSATLESRDKKLKNTEADLQGLIQANVTLSAQVNHYKESGLRERAKLIGTTALTGEELSALQQDVRDQDILIAGYQKENERLCEELKVAQQALKSSEVRLVRETQALRSEIRHLQETADTHPQQDRDFGLYTREIEKKLAEITTRERETTNREAELYAEVEQLRVQKRELEAKLGGVDLTQILRENNLVKELEKEMGTLQNLHKAEVSRLQAKIQWYIDNQQLLTQNDQLVAHQQSMISDLQARLQQQSEERKKKPSKWEENKRMKELEKKIVELESLLSRKQGSGNTLESLIRATSAENDIIVSLKNSLKTQAAEHAAKEAELNKGLRALRQEHERIKAQFETQVKLLKDRAPRSEHTRATTKAADVEVQMSALRTQYQTKIQELQHKLKLAKTKGKALPINNAHPVVSVATQTSQNGDIDQHSEKVKSLEAALSKRDQEVLVLNEEMARTKHSAKRQSNTVDIELAKTVASLHQQVTSLEASKSADLARFEKEKERLQVRLQHVETVNKQIVETESMQAKRIKELDTEIRGKPITCRQAMLKIFIFFHSGEGGISNCHATTRHSTIPSPPE